MATLLRGHNVIGLNRFGDSGILAADFHSLDEDVIRFHRSRPRAFVAVLSKADVMGKHEFIKPRRPTGTSYGFNSGAPSRMSIRASGSRAWIAFSTVALQ